MQKFFLIVLAMKALMLSAYAADLPVKVAPLPTTYTAPYSWTGFYVGISGGYASGRNDLSIVGNNPTSVAVINAGAVLPSYGTGASGGMVGGQIGYNWQMGNFVFGPEVDISWVGIEGSASSAFAAGPFLVSTHASESVNWLGSVRARAGWLVTPTTLLYATGGGAFGGVKSEFAGAITGPRVITGGAAGYNNSDVKWGWVVGGGIEQALGNRWSVKAEYKYFDLSDISGIAATKIGGTPISFTGSQDYKVNTVVLGVNYKF